MNNIPLFLLISLGWTAMGLIVLNTKLVSALITLGGWVVAWMSINQPDTFGLYLSLPATVLCLLISLYVRFSEVKS